MSIPIIRLARLSDLSGLIKIEKACFDGEKQWDANSFKFVILDTNSSVYILSHNNQDIGFIVASTSQNNSNIIQIDNIAIMSTGRRRGFGTLLLLHLIEIESTTKKIITICNEYNLTCQLFLQSLNFKCIKILKDYYDETDDHGYLMECHISKSHSTCAKADHATTMNCNNQKWQNRLYKTNELI